MASNRIEALKSEFRAQGTRVVVAEATDTYLPAQEGESATLTVLNPGPGMPFDEVDEIGAYEVGIRYSSGIPAARFQHDISGEEDISPASSSIVDGWVCWLDERLFIAWQWLELGTGGWAIFQVDPADLPDPEAPTWLPSDFRAIAERITEAVLENGTADESAHFAE